MLDKSELQKNEKNLDESELQNEKTEMESDQETFENSETIEITTEMLEEGLIHTQATAESTINTLESMAETLPDNERKKIIEEAESSMENQVETYIEDTIIELDSEEIELLEEASENISDESTMNIDIDTQTGEVEVQFMGEDEVELLEEETADTSEKPSPPEVKEGNQVSSKPDKIEVGGKTFEASRDSNGVHRKIGEGGIKEIYEQVDGEGVEYGAAYSLSNPENPIAENNFKYSLMQEASNLHKLSKENDILNIEGFMVTDDQGNAVEVPLEKVSSSLEKDYENFTNEKFGAIDEINSYVMENYEDLGGIESFGFIVEKVEGESLEKQMDQLDKAPDVSLSDFVEARNKSLEGFSKEVEKIIAQTENDSQIKEELANLLVEEGFVSEEEVDSEVDNIWSDIQNRINKVDPKALEQIYPDAESKEERLLDYKESLLVGLLTKKELESEFSSGEIEQFEHNKEQLEGSMERFDKVSNQLAILHENGLAHGDIKPDNIVGDKLIDYGMTSEHLFPGNGTPTENIDPGVFSTSDSDTFKYSSAILEDFNKYGEQEVTQKGESSLNKTRDNRALNRTSFNYKCKLLGIDSLPPAALTSKDDLREGINYFSEAASAANPNEIEESQVPEFDFGSREEIAQDLMVGVLSKELEVPPSFLASISTFSSARDCAQRRPEDINVARKGYDKVNEEYNVINQDIGEQEWWKEVLEEQPEKLKALSIAMDTFGNKDEFSKFVDKEGRVDEDKLDEFIGKIRNSLGEEKGDISSQDYFTQAGEIYSLAKDSNKSS